MLETEEMLKCWNLGGLQTPPPFFLGGGVKTQKIFYKFNMFNVLSTFL